MLASIIHQAGCPKGVFNLVMGRGSVVGEAMVENPLINGISFTGSVPIGRALAVKAAEHMKKLQLEMGGKNPMVVMDDADLDVSIPVCINGAFFSTGQRCTASSRLLVHEKICDDFVMKLSSETKKLTVGDPLEDGIAIGPVVSENQLKGNLDYVALAQQEGADVVGGERLNLSKTDFSNHQQYSLTQQMKCVSRKRKSLAPVRPLSKSAILTMPLRLPITPNSAYAGSVRRVCAMRVNSNDAAEPEWLWSMCPQPALIITFRSAAPKALPMERGSRGDTPLSSIRA